MNPGMIIDTVVKQQRYSKHTITINIAVRFRSSQRSESTHQSSYPSSTSLFALRSAARSSLDMHAHPSTLSANSSSHFSSSANIFLLFFGGGGRGGGGGGVRRLACSGAMRLSIPRDALASGLCTKRGTGEPSGEFTLELARRMSADMESFREGMPRALGSRGVEAAHAGAGVGGAAGGGFSTSLPLFADKSLFSYVLH